MQEAFVFLKIVRFLGYWAHNEYMRILDISVLKRSIRKGNGMNRCRNTLSI